MGGYVCTITKGMIAANQKPKDAGYLEANRTLLHSNNRARYRVRVRVLVRRRRSACGRWNTAILVLVLGAYKSRNNVMVSHRHTYKNKKGGYKNISAPHTTTTGSTLFAFLLLSL